MFLLQSFLVGNLFFQLQKAEGHEASFYSESCAFYTVLISVHSELEIMRTKNGKGPDLDSYTFNISMHY